MSRFGLRFVGMVLAVLLALMVYILFAPLLGIPEQRRLSADVAAFDRTAREAPVRQVTGHASWQTKRANGRGGGRYSFHGFDFYLLDGKRLRFSCLGETACPPSGKQGVMVPDAVRVSYVQTPGGYRLPVEISDMSGQVVISRTAALAAIDRRAQREQAHPYDPGLDYWLFVVICLIFAGWGWQSWRDHRAGKASKPGP